jgi:hypothetical protein
LVNWMHSKRFICMIVAIWKTTVIYWPIERILKVLFVEVCQFERTTVVYWPIECNSKVWFIKVLQLERITFLYWPIKCTQSVSFVKVFQLEITTFIYWSIEYIPKASFLRMFQFEKLLSFIRHWVHLKILICVSASTCNNYLHVNWPIKCTPKVLIVGITYVYWPI